MATWAIGDIQGCYAAFQCLLEKTGYDPARDQLWLVGDLVNRGPDSHGVLKQVVQWSELYPDAVRIVLGNHDLHLLACWEGVIPHKRKDTFDDILNAPDADHLLTWLTRQPLFHADPAIGYCMSHAGIPHLWTLEDARRFSLEVQTLLASDERSSFLGAMYGDTPTCWNDSLEGLTRLRVITNYLTRMRFVNAHGALDLTSKGEPDHPPEGYHPWFNFIPENSLGLTLLFGHWAALMGKTRRTDIVGLDTGCVWGGQLTAFCLETRTFVQCECQQA